MLVGKEVNLGYLLSIIRSDQLIKIYSLDNSGEVILYEGMAAPAYYSDRYDHMNAIYLYVDNDQYLNILV